MARRIKASMVVRDMDRGYHRLKTLQRQLRDNRTFVKVGVIGNRKTGYEPVSSGLDMVGLAIVHEYGSPSRNIPARPWIRPALVNHAAKYRAMQVMLVRGIYGGTITPERALGLLGVTLATDIRNYVTQGAPIPPPNKPATLRKKMRLGSQALQRRTTQERKREHIPRARNEGRAQGPIMVRTLVDTGRMLNSVAWVVYVQGQERRQG